LAFGYVFEGWCVAADIWRYGRGSIVDRTVGAAGLWRSGIIIEKGMLANALM
jgi:hypothetical protein